MGGGKNATYFLTQAKNTMFHDFWTRKLLAQGETSDDFIEVTAAQKADLEAVREAWTRPPQQFIDQWNTACGIWGLYNEESGYFELNGLTDITYKEALSIYNAGPLLGDSPQVYGFNRSIRTNLPSQKESREDYRVRYRQFFTQFSKGLEIVNLNPVDREAPVYGTVENDISANSFCSDYTFTARIYLGILDLSRVYNAPFYCATGCKSCEQLYVRNIKVNANLKSMLNLKRECYEYMVDNAANTNAITITVAPDIYNKLIDETNTEWHSLLSEAQNKNIQFIV